MYATDFWRDTVRRLDPRTLRVTATLQLKLPFFIVTSTRRDNAFLPEQVAVGDGSVWVASDRGALARADPHLRRLTAMVRLPSDAFQAIATAPGTVWLSESLLGLYRVSAKTNRVVARIPIGPADGRFVPVQLLPAGKWLLAIGEWTNAGTLTKRDGLVRLDPARNRVEAVTPLPPGQLTAAYGGGSLWVGRVNSALLEKIDPDSGKVLRRLRARVGLALAFAGGSLWTSFRDGKLPPAATRMSPVASRLTAVLLAASVVFVAAPLARAGGDFVDLAVGSSRVWFVGRAGRACTRRSQRAHAREPAPGRGVLPAKRRARGWGGLGRERRERLRLGHTHPHRCPHGQEARALAEGR